MYSEDELLPLSALQHLIFCERQCALIHIEQAWVENRLTAEGRIMHERVHQSPPESRGKVRVAYGLPLRSLRLGLSGQADVVEFHTLSQEGSTPGGSHSRITEAVKRPFPIEYKRGQPKANGCDEVQLCAQALCLEEMLSVKVPRGALFYGKTRRRKNVTFNDYLRRDTETAASRLHDLFAAGVTPPARYGPKCQRCSLIDRCMPSVTEGKQSAKRYLANVLGHETRRDDG